ncbi:MAG: hypothetical protein LC647_12395, partial [Beggiatoa sp.]|nr:hypothetical protein [Beggiatoa sp.]
ERSLFAHLVGAAFSLWRAAFLVGSDREWPNVLEKAKLFLEWVLQDNAITFGRDRDASNWTVGYYLNKARYRVARMSSNVADHATYSRLRSTEAFQALQGILESGGIDERDPKEMWNQLYEALWAAFEMLRGAEVLNKAQEP